MKTCILILSLLLTPLAHAEVTDDWETVSGQNNNQQPQSRTDALVEFDNSESSEIQAGDCISSAQLQGDSYKAEALRGFTTGYLTELEYNTLCNAVDALVSSLDAINSAHWNACQDVYAGCDEFIDEDEDWENGDWSTGESKFASATTNFNDARDFACSVEADFWNLEKALRENIDQWEEEQE